MSRNRKYKDITVAVYGMLTVVSYSHSNNGTYWNCECECGNSSVVKATVLNYGGTKSCGCKSKEQAIKNCASGRDKIMLPYPHSRKLKDLYRNLMDRCYNETNKRWNNYGGKGVVVCDEWKNSRRSFYAWASDNGYDPKLQIDRIYVNGNYEPGNCRFVTAIVQMNNTTRNHWIEWENKKMTVAEWERHLGWKKYTLQKRLGRGWPIERAMNQIPRESRYPKNHD